MINLLFESLDIVKIWASKYKLHETFTRCGHDNDYSVEGGSSEYCV